MAAQESRKAKTSQKSYFDVLGICCPSEVPLIENILNSLDGVKEFSVIVPSRTVIVVHDSLQISQLQIVKALNEARLEANVRVYGETSFKKKWPSPFAVVSGILLALSFLKYVYSPFKWLAVAAVAVGIFPILSKAFASIRRFRLDINTLALISVVGTIAMKDYTEAGTIVFLFTIAEWLESRASHKASAVMLSLMSLAPQKAVLAETGEEVEVDSVNLNTIISVKAGETVPIDGVVVDGNCEIDEKTLTGEPFPVSKQKDSTVWAGTINLNGYVSVRTTALSEDCVVAKMVKLVEEAQNSKTRTQRFIDRCSHFYTPAVVVVSACVALVPVAFRVKNPTHWFHLALVVLVSACPCGLILSTPVATFCALTKAATTGLLIKGGDYLETLAKIKIAAFDKTGTITRGEFVVSDFQSLSHGISLKSLLYWVSSIESKSSHPMASTLVDYAKSESVQPKPENVEDFENFPGEGISGKIDGREIYIGNKRIAQRAGCSTVLDMEGEMKGGKTVGYIFAGGRLIGVFSLSDACRSGVVQALKELKSLGIKSAMLTGDNQAAAMHAQEQLGNALDVVHAELLPEDKARIITEFKKEGRTAMIGDGLNDAPALATADIGISMGVSGSALATETGNIILMSNDIRKIPKAIRLARKAHRKVIENVGLSILIKGGILVLAISGYPLIWAAVLADVGTCLLVIFNSMLLLREKHKPADKCYRASDGLKKQNFKNSENQDLEANIPNCESGCCGKKDEHKISVASTVDTEGGLQTKNTGSCNSVCCEDQKVKLSTIRQRCCNKSSDSATKMQIQSDDDCVSGCCGDKTVQEKEHVSIKGCCEEPFVLVRGFQMKGTAGDCRSSCCGENIKGQSSPDKINGPEIVAEMESNESSKPGCCGKKDEHKILVIKTADTKGDLQTKNSGSCNSGCCAKKDQQVNESTIKQSCCEKPSDSAAKMQIKTGGDCNSGCCGDKTVQEKNHVSEKAFSKERSDPYRGFQMKGTSGNCISSCCGESIKEQGPPEKLNCPEIVVEIENNEDHKSGCCGKKEHVEEKVQKQSCCAKLDPEIKFEVKNNNTCSSSCSGRTVQVPEKTAKETFCAGTRESEFELLKDYGGDCKTSCRGSKEQVMKTDMKQSCCIEEEQEEEAALRIRSAEEIKSKLLIQSCCETKDHGCGNRGHYAGGCCRSYVRECCRHRKVGGSRFGGLAEIVIE